MQIFDGRYHASLLDNRVVSAPLSAKQTVLAIFQIGDNKASEKYVALKKAYCAKVGVAFEVFTFSTTQLTEARHKLQEVADDQEVGSIIVQLPLPDSSFYSLLDLLPLEKDVDVLSTNAKKRYFSGDFTVLSPVVRAADYFLCSISDKYDSAQKVGIVGYGDLVGKPLEKFFSAQGQQVEVITQYSATHKLDFDVVLLCTDVPNLVNGQDISAGANVIDFGSAVVEGKTVGNLNMQSKLEHLANISPSPGGMGPLVVRFLVLNHLRL